MRAAAAAIGVVFGFTLAWSGMADPDVIRSGLLLESAYLFLFFAAALGTAVAGMQLLRRARGHALVTGEPVSWRTHGPERRHIAGSVIFGLGWAIAASCPGPIAAQLGDGTLWAIATTAGLLLGVKLALVQRPAPALVPEPATR
jgi:uncharacterized membrane protein YedE/YeeE